MFFVAMCAHSSLMQLQKINVWQTSRCETTRKTQQTEDASYAKQVNQACVTSHKQTTFWPLHIMVVMSELSSKTNQSENWTYVRNKNIFYKKKLFPSISKSLCFSCISDWVWWRFASSFRVLIKQRTQNIFLLNLGSITTPAKHIRWA